MAVLTLTIGNRDYTLSCQDGEEAQLRNLAESVHTRVSEIQAGIGPNTSDSMVLVMAALMQEDEMRELSKRAEGMPATSPEDTTDADEAVVEAIDAIADYVETVADRIEKG